MSRIPPYQDIATLTANLCISERTVDMWTKQGLLPPPKNTGGKRLWKWVEVEAYIDGTAGNGIAAELEAIRHEAKKQSAGRR